MQTKAEQSEAFTLTELLVVIAVIALFVVLQLPALEQTKERVKRVACTDNCKKMALASRMYSNDTPDGAYANEVNSGADDLNFEYPAYVTDLKIFICPATQNYIRTNVYNGGPDSKGIRPLRDLHENAVTPGFTSGHSYEVKGWYVGLPSPVKKTYITVNNYVLTADHGFFNLRGIKPGPANTFVIMDADDTSVAKGGTPPAYNDFPDETDNHGRAGNNVAFCDGHAEFIKATRWQYRYVLSEDSNLAVPPWWHGPNLTN